MRQLTLAVARWGRALGACPASTIVATQVVRTWPMNSGRVEMRSAAAVSAGSLAKRDIAAPISPPTCSLAAMSEARATSVDRGGESLAPTRLNRAAGGTD